MGTFLWRRYSINIFSNLQLSDSLSVFSFFSSSLAYLASAYGDNPLRKFTDSHSVSFLLFFPSLTLQLSRREHSFMFAQRAETNVCRRALPTCVCTVGWFFSHPLPSPPPLAYSKPLQWAAMALVRPIEAFVLSHTGWNSVVSLRGLGGLIRWLRAASKGRGMILVIARGWKSTHGVSWSPQLFR